MTLSITKVPDHYVASRPAPIPKQLLQARSASARLPVNLPGRQVGDPVRGRLPALTSFPIILSQKFAGSSSLEPPF